MTLTTLTYFLGFFLVFVVVANTWGCLTYQWAIEDYADAIGKLSDEELQTLEAMRKEREAPQSAPPASQRLKSS